MKRALLLLCLMTVAVSEVPQGPPSPPGFKAPRKRLHTPKAGEQAASLGKRMSLRGAPAISLPPGLYITNITLFGTNVTLSWNQSSTVQVQRSTDLAAWADMGNPVTGTSSTLPATEPKSFYRLKVVAASSGPPFAISFGGALNDACTAITRDAQGDLAAVGYYGQVMFVQKRNALGDLIWERTASGANPSCVSVDGGGNVFVGGSIVGTASFGAENLVSHGQADCFIAKYSADGFVEWVKGFGSTNGSDVVTGIAVSGGGASVVACGYFQGPTIIDEQSLTSEHLFMSWLGSFATGNGHCDWAKQGNPNSVQASFNFGRALDVDAAGNILLIGYSQAGNLNWGCGLLPFNASKGYVAKFSSSGACLMARNYGSDSNNTRFWGGRFASNGDVLVAGDFQFSTDLGGGTITGGSYALDGFVARFSGVDGAYQKATQLRGNGPSIIDQSLFCTVDQADTLTLVGIVEGSYSSGSQTVASPGLGSPRGFAMRFDTGLNATWSAMLSGDGQSQINGAYDAGQSGCYMAGSFSGNATFGGMPMAASGGSDGCVLHTK